MLGLGLIRKQALRVSSPTARRHDTVVFAVIMGGTTLLATVLHGMEVSIWAGTYRFLGALPTNKTAMLYSLNAITSLRTREFVFGRSLAPHGRVGGFERLAVVRANHSFSVRRNGANLVWNYMRTRHD